MKFHNSPLLAKIREKQPRWKMKEIMKIHNPPKPANFVKSSRFGTVLPYRYVGISSEWRNLKMQKVALSLQMHGDIF